MAWWTREYRPLGRPRWLDTRIRRICNRLPTTHPWALQNLSAGSQKPGKARTCLSTQSEVTTKREPNRNGTSNRAGKSTYPTRKRTVGPHLKSAYIQLVCSFLCDSKICKLEFVSVVKENTFVKSK